MSEDETDIMRMVYSTPVKGIRGDEERCQRVIGRLQDAVARNGAEVIIRTAELGAVLNALTFAVLPRDDTPGAHRTCADSWEDGPHKGVEIGERVVSAKGRE